MLMMISSDVTNSRLVGMMQGYLDGFLEECRQRARVNWFPRLISRFYLNFPKDVHDKPDRLPLQLIHHLSTNWPTELSP